LIDEYISETALNKLICLKRTCKHDDLNKHLKKNKKNHRKSCGFLC